MKINTKFLKILILALSSFKFYAGFWENIEDFNPSGDIDWNKPIPERPKSEEEEEEINLNKIK